MSFYSKLVLERGELGAKEYMRQIRKNRTAPGYFSSLSKEELAVISKRGGKVKKNAGKE